MSGAIQRLYFTSYRRGSPTATSAFHDTEDTLTENQ